jgi:hypothetical protein
MSGTTGLAWVGGIESNGSGDLFIAFSTANHTLRMARIASGERFELLAPWLIPPASKCWREGEAQSRSCS